MKAVIKRIFGLAANDQPSNVVHICHQHSTNFASNLRKLGIIQLPRIGRKACQDNLWSMFQCQLTNFFIINLTSLDIFNAVADEVVLAG